MIKKVLNIQEINLEKIHEIFHMSNFGNNKNQEIFGKFFYVFAVKNYFYYKVIQKNKKIIISIGFRKNQPKLFNDEKLQQIIFEKILDEIEDAIKKN